MYDWDELGFEEEELRFGIGTDSIGEDKFEGEANAIQDYRIEKSRSEKNNKSCENLEISERKSQNLRSRIGYGYHIETQEH